MSAADPKLRIDRSADSVGFWIHVTPRSRAERVGPLHGDALRVGVKAPPADGRANAACKQLLADRLDVPPARVEIDPASRSRRKRVTVHGDPDALAARLHVLAHGTRVR